MSERKLLIVDDDPHIRRLLKIFLRGSGYELYEAATGDEALSLAGENAFDVILLDLILPYSGGFRLCQKFKSMRSARHPYVIIMTGDDSSETRTTAKECGSDDFIAKPFDAKQVAAMIASVSSTAV